MKGWRIQVIEEWLRETIVLRVPLGLEEANTMRGWRIQVHLIKFPQTSIKNQPRRVKGKKKIESREKVLVIEGQGGKPPN